MRIPRARARISRRLLEKKSDFRGHPCARDSNDSAPRVGKTRSLRQDSRRRIFRRFSVIILPKEGTRRGRKKISWKKCLRSARERERNEGVERGHSIDIDFPFGDGRETEDRWRRRRREDAGRWCWPWRRRNGGLRTGT